MNTSQKLLLPLIILAYLFLGGVFAFSTPPWQAPDEPAHYNYIRQIAETGQLPELRPGCYDADYLHELTSRRFPPELSVSGICYENHQPPLYYLLGAVIYKASQGNLYALRLFSVLLSSLLIVLVFQLTRTIFPEDSLLSLGAAAGVAFIPMHLSMMSALNNDVLAEVLIAVLLLLLSRRILAKNHSGVGNWLVIGFIFGLGLMTKLTVYSLLPVILLAVYYSDAAWRRRVLNVLMVSLPAAVISLPLYIRNMRVYGDTDPFALQRHNEIVIGQLRTAEYVQRIGWLSYIWEFISTSFQSFWGQFGWMAVPMHSRVYFYLAVLSVLSAGGLVTYFRRSWFRLALEQRRCLSIFLLMIFISLLTYIWWNITFVQFQARYLYPALMPLSIFFAIGLRKAFSRQMVLSGLIISALFTILAFSVTLGIGRLDKVSVLIPAVFTFVYLARLKSSILSAKWLYGLAYTSLAALCAVSPWWYIIPYLKL